MSDIKYEGVFVKSPEDKYVPIQELDREDYESFLEMMNKLRCAYIAITNKRENE